MNLRIVRRTVAADRLAPLAACPPVLARAYAARGIALDEDGFDHFMADYEANAAVLTV